MAICRQCKKPFYMDKHGQCPHCGWYAHYTCANCGHEIYPQEDLEICSNCGACRCPSCSDCMCDRDTPSLQMENRLKKWKKEIRNDCKYKKEEVCSLIDKNCNLFECKLFKTSEVIL